jgi:archaellum component FlaG (FlaF/FlaG flagellin family)
MTIDILKTRQPDLVKAGYLISAIIIFVINIIIIAGVLGLMTRGFSFTGFMSNAWDLTVEMYKRIFTQLFLSR